MWVGVLSFRDKCECSFMKIYKDLFLLNSPFASLSFPSLTAALSTPASTKEREKKRERMKGPLK